MAITFVQNVGMNYSNSASARTLSFSSNVTAGSLLIVGVGTYNDAAATVTVSDNLNGSWTQAGTYTTQGLARVSIWYFANSAAGSCTITVTPSVDSYISFNVDEFSGMQTSSVLDGTVGNTGTNTTTPSSGTIPVSGSSRLLFALYASTSSFGAPTCRYVSNSNLACACADGTASSDAALTITSDLLASYAARGASFVGASSPASSPLMVGFGFGFYE